MQNTCISRRDASGSSAILSKTEPEKPIEWGITVRSACDSSHSLERFGHFCYLQQVMTVPRESFDWVFARRRCHTGAKFGVERSAQGAGWTFWRRFAGRTINGTCTAEWGTCVEEVTRLSQSRGADRTPRNEACSGGATCEATPASSAESHNQSLHYRTPLDSLSPTPSPTTRADPRALLHHELPQFTSSMDPGAAKSSPHPPPSAHSPPPPQPPSFAYNPPPSISSLPSSSAPPSNPPSQHITPNTTLLPPAPLFGRAKPPSLSSQPSSQLHDTMHHRNSRPASTPTSSPDRNQHPSRQSPQPLTLPLTSHQQPPPPHQRPQTVQKLETFQPGLPQPPVMDRADSIQPSHSSQLTSLASSPPAQRFPPSKQPNIPDQYRPVADSTKLDQPIHPQPQQPTYPADASHPPLPQMQTRPPSSHPSPPQQIPQINLPDSSQLLQPPLDTAPLRLVSPPLANMNTQSQVSQMHPSPTDSMRPSNRQPSHKKTSSSPKQDSRQHAASRPHMMSMQQSMDRQRALQPRQPPPLPARPVMLAPPRGSIVMQDVPRYQRQVLPTAPPHQSQSSQMHDLGPPGTSQPPAAATSGQSDAQQIPSAMEQAPQPIYQRGTLPPHQMSAVPSMAQQRSTTPPARAISPVRQSAPSQSPISHGLEHRQQTASSERALGKPIPFHRDLAPGEKPFLSKGSLDPPHHSSNTAHQSSDLQASRHHRLGSRGGGGAPLYLNPATGIHVDTRSQGSSHTPADNGKSRQFDADHMSMRVRDVGSQSHPPAQGVPEGLPPPPSGPPMHVSVMTARQQPVFQGGIEGHEGIQGHVSIDSRPQLRMQAQEDRAMSLRQIGPNMGFASGPPSVAPSHNSVSGVDGTIAGPQPMESAQKSEEPNDEHEDQRIARGSTAMDTERPEGNASASDGQFVEGLANSRWGSAAAPSLNLMATSASEAERKGFQSDHEWRPSTNAENNNAARFSKNSQSDDRKVTRVTEQDKEHEVDSTPVTPRAKAQGQVPAPQPTSSRSQTADEGTPHTSPNNLRGSQSVPNPTQKPVSSRNQTGKNEGQSREALKQSVANLDHLGSQAVSSGAPGQAESSGQEQAGNMQDSRKKAQDRDRGPPTQAEAGNRQANVEDNGGSQRRQLKVEDALAYLEKVKSQFSDQLSVYNKFLDIMKEFKAQSIDTTEVIRRVSDLFRGHKDLILGFNTFLPPGYKIRVTENRQTGILNAGFHGPEGVFSALPPYRKVSSKSSAVRSNGKKKGSGASSPKRKDSKKPGSVPPAHEGLSYPLSAGEPGEKDIGGGPPNGGMKQPHSGQKSATVRRTTSKGQPVEDIAFQGSKVLQQVSAKGEGTEARAHEFERAIGFVTTIKERFVDSPETFNEFLDALSRFREEQKSIREVFEAVAELFGPHKDLLSQFKEFIPSIAFSGLPDAKPVKARGANQLSRRLPGSKVISESTPNQRSLGPNGKAKVRHRPRDMQFFEDLKSQLGPNKSHLYTEFIKCLSLFSQHIVSKDELLHLTAEILHDDQDAHSSFLEYLEVLAKTGDGGLDDGHQISSSISSEDEPTAVDAARLAYYTSKPMSEIAAEAGIEQLYSYRRMPLDFPSCEYSGRSVQERRTLNDSWINVTTGSEDYSFKFMRRNQNEDNLFRCEDDRYELDLVIETNSSTIMKLESIVATISKLPLGEKRRHALAPGVLSPVHFNAIQRIYGENGSEVISQIRMNPSMALPVVLKRLKEKDISWRWARMEMNKVWRAVGERNFHRSLDHRSGHFKAVDKKDLSTKSLLLDILDPAASVQTRDAEMTRARGYPVENGGGGANHRSQAVKAVLAASKAAPDFSSRCLELKLAERNVHRSIFRLICDIVDDEVTRTHLKRFGALVQSFFNVKLGDDVISGTEVNEGRETNVLYGDDSVYILLRLYHLLFERVMLALTLAREQVADRERRNSLNVEGKRRMAERGRIPAIETQAWQLTKAITGQDSEVKFSLGPATETAEEIFEQFLGLAKQFARGKLDWSKYEDKCRTLLGVDSYGVFTIDKTLHKVTKAIDSVFANDSTSRAFCDLFHRCKERMRESRQGNGKLDVNGIEVLYSVAASRHLSEVRNPGSNLMRFQSSYEDDDESDLIIHIVGQTCEEDMARSRGIEAVVLDDFLEFCGSYGDCERHGPHAETDDREVSGDHESACVNETSDIGRKRTGSSKDDDTRPKKRRRGGEVDFLRFVKDKECAAERLGRSSLIIENELEWRLDQRGTLQFSTGKCDFLYFAGRKRAWDEGLDRKIVNDSCLRTKKMRRILKLDRDERPDSEEYGESHTEGSNANTAGRTETESEKKRIGGDSSPLSDEAGDGLSKSNADDASKVMEGSGPKDIDGR